MQAEAVLHGEGPMLLLAGAGSGKTRVVTHRIARLIDEGERASSIVAVTFTNRAAREMSERVEQLLGPERTRGLNISTFHALGARFLRRHGERLSRTERFTIYDDSDRKRAVRDALDAIGATTHLSGEEKTKCFDVVHRALDTAKNAGLGSGDLDLPLEHAALDVEAFGDAYDGLLRRADAFDFGDLILRPAQLLEEDEVLARTYRARWRWLLVDEFQDTNPAQYRLLRQLAPPGLDEQTGKPANLFVVGDDDQSIYGWRGAEVENILNFPDEFACAPLRLEQNYRSAGYILRAANEVIRHNERRLGKSLWTERPDGMRLEVHVASDGRSEARWVAGRIRSLCHDEGFAASEVAVLMRANHLAADLEIALAGQGIGFVVLRGRAFYERASVKDALAYARLLHNHRTDSAFQRAVAAPPRGVGAKSLANLSAVARELECSLYDAVEPAIERKAVKGKAARGLRAFVALLDDARESGEPPSQMLKNAVVEAGLVAAPESDDREGRDEHVETLLVAINEYERDAAEPDLGEFLEQVALIGDTDAPGFGGGGAVSLMTVHAAKGLEFPVVFVMGLEEGLFPHERSIESDDLEEERRLCYVALTRAEKRLFLSHARQRWTFREARHTRPSRFLGELPGDVVEPTYVPDVPAPRRERRRRGRRAERVNRTDAKLDAGPTYDPAGAEEAWRSGMMVWHGQFGAGRVLKVKGGMRTMLDVDFPDIGRKTIVARYVSPYEG